MAVLVWAGVALALAAVAALVVLALKARGIVAASDEPDALRAALARLAAYNGAALGLGLMGAGLMVVGFLL